MRNNLLFLMRFVMKSRLNSIKWRDTVQHQRAMQATLLTLLPWKSEKNPSNRKKVGSFQKFSYAPYWRNSSRLGRYLQIEVKEVGTQIFFVNSIKYRHKPHGGQSTILGHLLNWAYIKHINPIFECSRLNKTFTDMVDTFSGSSKYFVTVCRSIRSSYKLDSLKYDQISFKSTRK